MLALASKCRQQDGLEYVGAIAHSSGDPTPSKANIMKENRI
jgi:hypothetical protein